MSPRSFQDMSGHASEETPFSESAHDFGSWNAPKTFDESPTSFTSFSLRRLVAKKISYKAAIGFSLVGIIGLMFVRTSPVGHLGGLRPVGPYELQSVQEGETFFDNYNFYDGPDSLGSAGYNVYVSEERATEAGIANVTKENVEDAVATSESGGSVKKVEEFIYMSSVPSEGGPRESVRLEGKERYDRGLFILDLRHMPAGCGIWPAWWLTDEANWPDNGEIDIVEGVNNQTVAKTALHTSDRCSMFAHVPAWSKTGHWDWATGLPDTYTGEMDFNMSKPADDCWVMAPHQWANQGCVAVNSDEISLGGPLNAAGGGIYALEWDPDKEHAIRSWVFPSRGNVPPNLREAIQTANSKDKSMRVVPDPNEWGLPYGYFAIGEGTGCSADHLKNMRLVFNLAFCGTVAGNRFFMDCPAEAKLFEEEDDPILSCNAFIKSNPDALEEAYWKIRGLYVYERTWIKPAPSQDEKQS